MGLEDGTSPHSGRNSYLSSHSPTHIGPNHSYASYPDNVVYTSIGKKIKNFKIFVKLQKIIFLKVNQVYYTVPMVFLEVLFLI